eukprot:SAG31_NODE_621_length_13502_cov_18.057002_13_plen_102_part_00
MLYTALLKAITKRHSIPVGSAPTEHETLNSIRSQLADSALELLFVSLQIERSEHRLRAMAMRVLCKIYIAGYSKFSVLGLGPDRDRWMHRRPSMHDRGRQI